MLLRIVKTLNSYYRKTAYRKQYLKWGLMEHFCSQKVIVHSRMTNGNIEKRISESVRIWSQEFFESQIYALLTKLMMMIASNFLMLQTDKTFMLFKKHHASDSHSLYWTLNRYEHSRKAVWQPDSFCMHTVLTTEIYSMLAEVPPSHHIMCPHPLLPAQFKQTRATVPSLAPGPCGGSWPIFS